MSVLLSASYAAAFTVIRSPSGNIICAYLGAYESNDGFAALQCATRNDGAGMYLSAGGERTEFTWYPPRRGRVLPYGYYRVIGPFRCDSTTNGMQCVVRRTGSGFFMSRDTAYWIG